MGEGPIPPLPDFPPTSYADQTPPPPVIDVSTEELERPTQAFAFPQSTLDQLYRWVYWFHKDHLAPSSHAHESAGNAVSRFIEWVMTSQYFVTVITWLTSNLGAPIFAVLDGLRKSMDPAFADISVSILNELLGSDLTAGDMPTGIGIGDHVARAEKLGTLLINQLESEFAPGTSIDAANGEHAASTFAGFAINFGVATGIIGTLGGLVPVLHVNELREIGENVANNIGLGRLVRYALLPLIRTTVQTPYQWFLNQKYHPTQLNEGMLVNPYAGGSVPHDLIFQTMDLLGYTTDKINALIALHARRLNISEIATAVRYGAWTEDAALTYTQRLGYTPEDAQSVLGAAESSKADSWVTKLVDAVLAEYVNGGLTAAELTQVLDTLPLHGSEKQIILALYTYLQQKHAGKTHHLSPGEMARAYEAGLIDLGELEDYYRSIGYDDNSVTIATQLVLLKTADDAAKAKAKAARQAAAAAKAAAKANPPATP